MRADIAADIEEVELQILRLLSVRRDLLDMAACLEERLGEVEAFLGDTLPRCRRLAHEHALDPGMARYLDPDAGRVRESARPGQID